MIKRQWDAMVGIQTFCALIIKKEGDGFQCDALGSDGYTYTFFFRNQPAPQSYLDQYLCPLHARIVELLDQVVSKNHTIGMNNLYISAKKSDLDGGIQIVLCSMELHERRARVYHHVSFKRKIHQR